MKPYIQCKGPDLAYLSSGKSSGSIGYHAFFVTYIPFIPSFLSDDFTRMVTGGTTRIKLIVSRQIRFLNDLCSFRSNSFETFDLRFISIPQEGQPYSNLHIFFIGKVFSPTKLEAETLAFQLWEKFQSNFPFEDPFNYPLRTITMQNNSSDKEFPSEPDLFNIAINPLSLKKENKWKIVEIRKYEDRDPMLVGGDENPDDHFVGYFPHPFMPTLDHSAMSRFLETFTKQDQICVASICLRPTTLALSEQQQIHRMIKHYEALAKSADEENNWISLYRIERIKDIAATFDPVMSITAATVVTFVPASSKTSMSLAPAWRAICCVISICTTGGGDVTTAPSPGVTRAGAAWAPAMATAATARSEAARKTKRARTIPVS